MQKSQLPARIAVPFANSGSRNTIPDASQIGITAGAASMTDGFPPLTMTPLAAGGVPPAGADMNGILYKLSLWGQWSAAGGLAPFDATFATAIGGYPQDAVLVSTTAGKGLWLNLVDNNATDPDSGGANWLLLRSGLSTMVTLQSAGSISFTVPAGVTVLRVRLTGAGGGGAGCAGTGQLGGGGGGGGEYREGFLAVSPGQVISGSVGAGGGGGGPGSDGVTANPGSNGGDTVFGSWTAQGGGGAPTSPVGSSAGGAGGANGSGGTYASGGGDGADTSGLNAKGGDGGVGGGGGGPGRAGSPDGGNAKGWGGGGGGAYALSAGSAGSGTGGIGGGGIIVIEY